MQSSLSGQTWMEHPPQRSLRFPYHHHSPVPHQHRLHGCSQRNQFTYHLRPHVLLHRYHFLRPHQAHSRSAPPRTPLVPRPLRHGYQYRESLLPVAALCICILPAGYTRRTEHDELGLFDVWWNYFVCNGILLDFWQEAVYTTGGTC
jgi:hypothetical protein